MDRDLFILSYAWIVYVYKKDVEERVSCWFCRLFVAAAAGVCVFVEAYSWPRECCPWNQNYD